MHEIISISNGNIGGVAVRLAKLPLELESREAA
jgi:hypothetical protein